MQLICIYEVSKVKKKNTAVTLLPNTLNWQPRSQGFSLKQWEKPWGRG